MKTSTPPTITNISPNQAGLAQNVTITINGTGFTGVSLVSFDFPGKPAGSGPAGTIIGTPTDTQIQVTVPTCPSGSTPVGNAIPIDITIGIGASTTQFPGLFSYQLPVVSSISPNQAGLDPSITITINGTGFAGTSLVSFDFPGNPAGSGAAGAIIGTPTDTQIQVTVPSCPGGSTPVGNAIPMDITIGIDAYQTQFPGRFSYQLPVVTSVSPTSGPLAGGTTIVVTGQYFTGSGTAVEFDGAGASDVQVLSDTTITCVNPNQPAGAANVSVMVQGTLSTSTVPFTYLDAPAVTQVSPNFGLAGTSVTLTGSGFTGATAVNFGSATVSISPPSVSDTTLTFTVPSGVSGTVDITVTTAAGTSATCGADRFQVGSTPFTIPLTIDLTGANLPAGTPAYAYIVGEVAQAGGVKSYYWLNPNTGVQPMATTDNAQAAGTFPGSSALNANAQSTLAANYPDAWANYSIPLSLSQANTINLASINPTKVPGLSTGTAAFSGRIYLSLGLPLLPFTVQSGGYAAPVPAEADSGTPGALCLFDWIEFSFDSNQNFNGNTTQVDQFGLALTLNGTPGGSLQGALSQTRQKIIAAFSAGGTGSGPFLDGTLVVPVPTALVGNQGLPKTTAYVYLPDTTHLRLISPKTNTASNTPDATLATFFDTTIAACYKNWATNPVVTQDPASGYYTGFVPTGKAANAGNLCFFKGNFTTQPTTLPEFILLSRSGKNITTSDIWQCAKSLALSGASTAQLNVGKILAAAFNRGIAGTSSSTSPLTDIYAPGCAADYYPADGVSNTWAQYFHSVSNNQLAYGFPYDDVCQQNPSINLTETLGVTITLAPLS